MRTRVLGILLSLIYSGHVFGVIGGGSAKDLLPGNTGKSTVVDPAQKVLSDQLGNHAHSVHSKSVITDFLNRSDEDALNEKEKIEEVFSLYEKIKYNSNLVTQTLHVTTLLYLLKKNTGNYFEPGTFSEIAAGLLEQLGDIENVSDLMKITIAKEYQDYKLKKYLREINEVVLAKTLSQTPKEFAEKNAYTKLELNRNPNESLFANKNALIGKNIYGKVLFQGSVYYSIQGKVVAVSDTGFTLETELNTVIKVDGSDFHFLGIYIESSSLEDVEPIIEDLSTPSLPAPKATIENRNVPINWKEPVAHSIGTVAFDDKIKFYHSKTGSKSLRVRTKNIGSNQVKSSFLKGMFYVLTFNNPNVSDSYISFDAPILGSAKEFKDANGKFFVLVRTENDFFILDPVNDSIVTKIKIQDTQSLSFGKPLEFTDLEDGSKLSILRVQGDRIYMITKSEDPQGVSSISRFNPNNSEDSSLVLFRLRNGNQGVVLEQSEEQGMLLSIQLDLERNAIRTDASRI